MKPTIAFVPGAWHTPSHYSAFLQKLSDAGYHVTSEKLPSVGATEPKDQSVAADMAIIREKVLLPEIEQGKDIIMIMHSYGGFPGSAAAKGFSKLERTAAGKAGGIIGMIFMCAFVANEDESLQSKLPNEQFGDWMIVNEESGQLGLNKPESVFYNGIENNLVEAALGGLQSHALAAFTTPSPPPAWKDEVFNGRRAYIKCQNDMAIPIVAQKMMVESTGLDWQELDLDASHSPFLTHSDEMCEFIEKRAVEWTK
ncbi:Alpha/beta hydrolase fold-1 [Mariannaea sp. PMI_226]|nr:Alpha/beta hydrolase fold-1 [Mariannaea sp. PMI_226]